MFSKCFHQVPKKFQWYSYQSSPKFPRCTQRFQSIPQLVPKNNNKEQCKDHEAQHICLKGHYNTVMGDALYKI
jgi:hypothetical protein